MNNYMMKVACVLTFTLLPAMALCQYFVLTPNGMVSAEVNDKEYLVLEFNGQSQQELYDLSHNYIVTKFNSAKEVLSASAPTVLSIYAVVPFKLSNGFYRYDTICKYKLNLTFRDGKIRVDYAIVGFSILPTNGVVAKFKLCLVRQNMTMAGIFNKKGEVIKVGGDEAKEAIESSANNLITGLIRSISGQETEDEW